MSEKFDHVKDFDWTTIEAGANVRIRDERGTFRFMKVNEKDGSLQCWGGVTGRERYRSFPKDRVYIPVVRKKKK